MAYIIANCKQYESNTGEHACSSQKTDAFISYRRKSTRYVIFFNTGRVHALVRAFFP